MKPEIIDIQPLEAEARILTSFVLEYNEEAQQLARDDRHNLLSIADGQGGTVGIPIAGDEKRRWKEMRRFRNLLVHGFLRFSQDGSITISPSPQWKSSRRDADIKPFPNGLGHQINNDYVYSLDHLRKIAGLFHGMSLRNRLQVTLEAYSLCPSCGSSSQNVIGLNPDDVIEFPCGLRMTNSTEARTLSKCTVR